MIYADYDYYKNEFGGSVVPEPSFIRAVKVASNYIDIFTFNRITELEIVDSIRDCACDMAETVYNLTMKNGEKNMKSESNDGYSVTYITERVDGQDVNSLLRNKLYSVCRGYLLRTGLMYRGVKCRC